MSSSLLYPVLLTAAFATGGAGTQGLVNSLGTVTSGVLVSPSISPLASIADGFPLLTMTNPSAGGVPPAGADLNGIFKYITGFQSWVNAGGQFNFNSQLASAIGGYPIGAVLQLNGGLGCVVNTVNGNTQDPNAAMTGWLPYGGAFPAGQVLVGNATGTISSTGLTYTPTAGLAVVAASTAPFSAVYGGTVAVTLTPSSSSTNAGIGLGVTSSYAGVQPSTWGALGLNVTATNNATAGVVTNIYGAIIAATHAGAGSTTNLIGTTITLTKSAGTVTNATGLIISAVSAGSSSNYAITTGAGVVSFGDNTIGTGTSNSGALLLNGGLGLTQSTTNPGGNAYGATVQNTVTLTTGQVSSYGGSSINLVMAGSQGTSGNAIGAYLGASNTCTAGTVNTLTANYIVVTHSGAGTTTALQGIYILLTKTAGTVTTAYGLNVASVTAGASNYAIFTNAGVVSIGDTTVSSSTTTGALVVAGGVGIQGRLYLAGQSASQLCYANAAIGGAVANAMGANNGPTGSSTAIQGWISILVAGTQRFVPYW